MYFVFNLRKLRLELILHVIQAFAMDYGMTEWNELKIVSLVEFKDSVTASRKKWDIQDDSTF